MLTEHHAAPIDAEFDGLPASADEDTRQDLAMRFVPHVIEVAAQHPNFLAAQRNAPDGFRQMEQTVNLAMIDLYNPAQLDVLERVGREVRLLQTRHDTT